MKNRSFKHWTPRYVFNRSREAIYRKRNCEVPWLTSEANSLLARLICDDDVGVEFGSGRSTVWFCERVGHLLSVETDPEWYEWTKRRLQSKNLNNYTYECITGSELEANPEMYINFFEKYEYESFDFALVDGKFRGETSKNIMKKIKPGGLLIIDNVNRYIPTITHAPASVGVHGNAVSDLWSDIYDELAGWRCLNTSNGVCDTNIYIKRTIDC